MKRESKLIRKLRELPPEEDLKIRVERLEHRVSDLGSYVQAAVKEIRGERHG